MIRVAQVGTFDVDNLGDLLFPVVFDRLLAESAAELGSPIECTWFSPRGSPAGQLYRDQRASLPIEQLDRIDSDSPFDLVFIGGGDIIRDDDASLASIYPPQGSRPAFSQLSSPLKAADRRLVLLMPGVPLPLSRHFRTFLTNSFRRVCCASVRDRLSATRLAEVVPADVRLAVLPDIVSAIARFYPRTQLLALGDSLVAPELRRTGYICFQANPQFCADVNTTGQALLQLERKTGLPVLLIELGKALGDGQVVTQLAKRFAFAVARPPAASGPGTLMQRVAAIALSRGFLGTSLHGAILAHAYSVPHFCFSAAGLSKVGGFYETCSTGQCYSSHVDCFRQLDAISEWIGRPEARMGREADAAVRSSDHARVKNFVRKAIASAMDGGRTLPCGFALQADLQYHKLQTRWQRRFGMRIENLHVPALAWRYPRMHLAMRRAVKLLWWSVTFQLLGKYRARRERLSAPLTRAADSAMSSESSSI